VRLLLVGGRQLVETCQRLDVFGRGDLLRLFGSEFALETLLGLLKLRALGFQYHHPLTDRRKGVLPSLGENIDEVR
jgi:hypothetical protein